MIETAGDKWKAAESDDIQRYPARFDGAIREEGRVRSRERLSPRSEASKWARLDGCFRRENLRRNGSSAATIRRNNREPILQEFLEGENEEFTTGVSVSQEGKILASIAMRRKLKHGQTYKAFVDDFPLVRDSAEKAALALGGRGPINVQSRMVKGESVIFEINPRFSASCPIRAIAGVNEPDLVYRNQLLGEEVSIRNYEKLVALRYWNEVYVPQEAFDAASRGIVTVKKVLYSGLLLI